ncbi:hypothetical protein B0H66DRAFT_58090 [Apodospora peruviana]|uniref:Mid2 domain-containing protein n=1 Tax=Apodospora peruviana TaxID=516989 RepID=A0AAE0ISP1_9PEZI|nr:hypothetical protein B0H66DRAFT_58090 [Apodospora peruviana]
MRISIAKTWLALALPLGVVGTKEQSLTFTEGFEGQLNKSIAIFVLGIAQRRERIFKWDTTVDLEIESVNLWVYHDANQSSSFIQSARNDGGSKDTTSTQGGPGVGVSLTGVGDPPNGAASTGTGTGATGTSPPPPGENGSPTTATGKPDVTLTVSASKRRGSVTINDLGLLDQYLGLPLYFHVAWAKNSGDSYSRAFAVVKDPAQYDLLLQNDSVRFSEDTPFKAEENHIGSSTTGLSPGRTETSTPAVTAESAAGGRLSTGATIGIAVACGIVGLVLIGGLIWWFLMRRRRQTDGMDVPGRPYGAARNRTGELIAEKEAGAGVEVIPHSPYSDDGGIAGATGGGTTHEGGAAIPYSGGNLATDGTSDVAGAPVLANQLPRVPQQAHDQARSYTPYSDHASGGGGGGGVGSPSTHAASVAQSDDTATGRASIGSPTAGRATPHGSVAPQYAHLVEEGMTEDEIRRLEEEERQLDAEIARAGRR